MDLSKARKLHFFFCKYKAAMASNKSLEEKTLLTEEFHLKLYINKKKLQLNVANQKMHHVHLQLFDADANLILGRDDYANFRFEKKLVRRAKAHGKTLTKP